MYTIHSFTIYGSEQRKPSLPKPLDDDGGDDDLAEPFEHFAAPVVLSARSPKQHTADTKHTHTSAAKGRCRRAGCCRYICAWCTIELRVMLPSIAHLGREKQASIISWRVVDRRFRSESVTESRPRSYRGEGKLPQPTQRDAHSRVSRRSFRSNVQIVSHAHVH